MYQNGEKSTLKGTIDTQFGKAIIDASFFSKQDSGNSDLKFDYFEIGLSNLSRPIKDYIKIWESKTGKTLQRQGAVISLNALEWINEDDFRDMKLPSTDIFFIGEYRRSSYASEARTVMSNIANASKMYYQIRGDWPSEIDELERAGQLDVSRSTKLKWSFELQLSDQGGRITATSTEEMSGGAGHQVVLDLDLGKFTGYGSPDGD